ncbi:response regulator [Patescibacteria group bacterium]|nr:MAG: response regulator [Patescibacteria group bacterium]
METKVYTHNPGPVSRAFLQTVDITDHHMVEVAEQNLAEVVFVNDIEGLRIVYNDIQLFCVLATDDGLINLIAKKQPKNVVIVHARKLFDKTVGAPGLLEALLRHRAESGKQAVAEPVPVFTDLVEFKRTYRVLVIDDKPENLQIARTVLMDHAIVTVGSLEMAIRALDTTKFDAVLTDMSMPPDKTYPALNLSNYGVTEMVQYGFAVMLEATSRGLPVAIVTDGNHHQDWVSAMFDRMDGAVVNGQKVLFFNHIGKRWDKALKALMEP